MNSFDDLHDEFDRLTGAAPDDGALRTAIGAGITRRERRRRTTALIAVAASVILVVGGVGITRALTAPTPNSTRPAAPSPVVDVPEVPLPAGTQLIRHQLQPFTSPVSATPPEGLTASAWMNLPGRLAVWWYLPNPPTGTVDESELRIAGYVVTDSADDPVSAFDGSDVSVHTVDSEPITVGGHDAMLSLASADASDKMGMPATQRISWQLADGRYIHVFVNAAPSKDGAADPALLAFAESVIEDPTALIRTIGIGLTLPGLVEDISTNVPEVGFGTGGSVLLCPEGVDPYASSGSAEGSASGQGTASSSTVPPPDAATVTGSASAGPGETVTEITPDPENPLTSCITVFVVATAAFDSNSLPASTPITVAGTTVQVDTANNAARLDLRSGLLAVVAAPPATPLSADDLAVLAASVRLSPDVKVADSSGFSSGSAVSSAEEPASSAVMSSSAVMTAPPGLPLSVLRDADHPVGIMGAPSEPESTSGERLGTIRFFIRNVTDGMVGIDAISLGNATVTSGGPFLVNGDAGSLTLHEARARLDNVPSDAATPMTEVTTPMLMAPGSTVMFELDIAVGACAELPADPVSLALNYSMTTGGSSSGGGFSLDGELGLPRWVHDLTQEACGH